MGLFTRRRLDSSSVAIGLVLACSLVQGLACTGSSGSAGDAGMAKDAGDAQAALPVHVPFEADPPRVYVAKVKNLLVGAPPTDDEVAAVEQDPAQLRTLIEAWQKLPAYETKLLTFFQLAFQQTQITINDFADQTYPRQTIANPYLKAILARNAQESFARTALELVREGKPWTEVLTTRRFMMTPALMELYSYLDVWQVDDAGKVSDLYGRAHLGETITVTGKAPIPLTDTLDPSSPSYMHWYDPDVGDAKLGAGCTDDPIVYPMRSDALHFLLYGSLIAHPQSSVTAGAGAGGVKAKQCMIFAGSMAAPQLTAADFETWKMVTVRAPKSGEARTSFFDLSTLRSGSELVLTLPRVGFFTTPAFFANWQTNISNQMRVTINQTLIVALGASVDGTDETVPSSTPGLDAKHTQLAECATCHQTLDPTRSILAATYTWNYHDQVEPAFAQQKGLFVFRGVETQLTDVGALGDTLAQHPLFPSAWVQKLCYYANSAPCDGDDPEFQRVVKAFQAGYAWNDLIAELFSSPLVTHAALTQTADKAGVSIAVARRDHLCAALEQRLGLPDVCGLRPTTLKATRATVPEIAAGLPSDGYGRGAVAPVLPNEPTLFYRAGVENICASVAAQVIDPSAAAKLPSQKVWASSAPEAAVNDFVSTVMALTASDPRTAPARQLLLQHFHDAMQTGASASVALRSTFIVACTAPSSISIGL